MKLSLIKKMALLLVGLATVQGYAAVEYYTVSNQDGTSTDYNIVSDDICNILGCIFVGNNNLFDIGEFSFDANTNELVIQDLNTSLADGPERVYTISAYGKDDKTSYWSSSKHNNQGIQTGYSHYDYGYFNYENKTPCTSTFLQSKSFTVNKSGRHVFSLTSFINELKKYNVGQVRLVLEDLQYYDVNYSALKKYGKIVQYESFYQRDRVTYGAFVDVEFPPFYVLEIQEPIIDVPENGSGKVSLTLLPSKAFSFQLEMKDQNDDDNHWAVVRSGSYSLSEVNRVITLSEDIPWKKEPGGKHYRWKINYDDVVYYSGVYLVSNELPEFRLTFLGFEGEELWSRSIVYGINPAEIAPSLTVKEDSEEFRYFAKWTPEIVPLTEDATYKAVLDSVRTHYRVTYLNFDGVEISSQLVAVDDEPVPPTISVPEDDDTYHYYVKWTPEIVPLTEDATYKAVLDSVKKLLPTIQLAATYAVGGDVELFSTNAASCVSVKKNLLWANCSSFAESGNCKIGEMIYDYDQGCWLPMAGPQDWVSESVDVDLKVGKSYQLSYTLVRDFNKCTEAEFVNALTLVTKQDEIPVYINGSKVGTVSRYSRYFNFTLKSQYTITFFDDKGVQVGDVVTVASGMAVSAPAEPAKREGYTFAGWFQKDAETAYDFSAAVNEDLELYGKWTINKYEIAVAANDSKMGSVKGAGTYEYGTEVELVATAAEGYKFSNWEDDVKASATRKVKVTAAASYKANFEKIPESSASAEKTSSSSTKPKSSSSKTDAVVAAAAVPQFSLSVAGRNVQIAGARVGSAYAILDMQGRVLATGRTASASMEIAVPRAGSYMVRVGSQTKRVNVK